LTRCDIKIDRLTDRETERQTDRKTETRKDRKTETRKDRKTERQKNRKTERQKGRKTERQKDRKTERQKHITTERQRDRKKNVFFPLCPKCLWQRRTAAQIACKFAVKFSGHYEIKKDRQMDRQTANRK
jgi:hypothetical protein